MRWIRGRRRVTGGSWSEILAHHDADLMENIELPPEDVQTIIEETKLIYNSIKYSYDGKYDDFDDIMETVYLHTKQLINVMSDDNSIG